MYEDEEIEEVRELLYNLLKDYPAGVTSTFLEEQYKKKYVETGIASPLPKEWLRYIKLADEFEVKHQASFTMVYIVNVDSMASSNHSKWPITEELHLEDVSLAVDVPETTFNSSLSIADKSLQPLQNSECSSDAKCDPVPDYLYSALSRISNEHFEKSDVEVEPGELRSTTSRTNNYWVAFAVDIGFFHILHESELRPLSVEVEAFKKIFLVKCKLHGIHPVDGSSNEDDLQNGHTSSPVKWSKEAQQALIKLLSYSISADIEFIAHEKWSYENTCVSNSIPTSTGKLIVNGEDIGAKLVEKGDLDEAGDMRRVRSDVCRAILLTSIIWLLLDVIVLFYFLDRSLVVSDNQNLARSARFATIGVKNVSSKEKADPKISEELEKLLADLSFDKNGPGENGGGHTIDKEKETEMKEMFKQNQFNLMASNLISVNRSLPDYRSTKCKTTGESLKSMDLPSVSIIIVFHNEAFSTLLRTLHSVVNRSPSKLLAEIILVDDKSDRDYLKKPLELYTKRFPIPVHLVHLQERSGLIRARLTGSAMAKGKVLLFLDAHVEVTEGWLEPLVERVHADRKRVVAPIIDVISDETFEYVTASDTTWGGFNWHLNFRWYPVPDREMNRRNWDRSLPIQTPTIAGGLFAIDKQFFYDIGSYDEGMQVWGGENLEISFRVWMCGARTAEVWMDDYKAFFYSMVPAARNVDAGDVTARKALRTNLQCKSFKWYLETIYKEAPVPAEYYSIGQIMNHETRQCIDTMGKKSGQSPGVGPCHGIGGNQAWSITKEGEIRSDELCLSAKGMSLGTEIVMEKCSTTTTNIKHVFSYQPTLKLIIHKSTSQCLLVGANNSLEMKPCTEQPANSKWDVQNYKEPGGSIFVAYLLSPSISYTVNSLDSIKQLVVVNRSPRKLLAEIILVDDKSDRDYLKKPLELYTKRFPIPVHLVHLQERSGLIRARLTGSAMAKGKVLLFLDAHVEVTEGWLEPLVERVHADRKRVVAPIIDVISDETFEYVTASDTTWGGFNWHLNFRWYPVPDREMNRRNWDRSLPIQTPTIAGGLFAIDKQFFYDIGSYDEGMQVWGGENLEISFRVWMCGGSLEIHPCSRVGHVFRKQTPYTFPGGTATVIHHNAARTAEVWMDDYKAFFYSMVPAARNVDAGDVTARKALRTNLQCKSFKWYLETIYKEAPVPAEYYSIGQERSGLIRARLTGSAMAKGKVLLFLDAHVEVTEGWLEPLVERVHADRKRVVAPIIDVISDETFEYVTASDTTWGGFNWHLNFRWYPVPDREMNRRNWDRSLPIQTPTIAGGLFAIDKQFFYDIGSYDEGMQVWGGENLEISFRVWMCGGSLEIHPCSRVGHVFRKQTPYTFPGGTATVIHHNAARTAEVWMDDYKAFFYSMVPAARNVDAGDVTARKALRTNLQCKSFKWYLETIYKEAPVPAEYYSIGQIMNHETRQCIDTMGKKSGQSPGVGPCHGIGGNQAWSITKEGEIRSDELCLSAKGMSLGTEIVMEKCSTTTTNIKHVFSYQPTLKLIIHKSTSQCLLVGANNSLEMKPCTEQPANSKWDVQNYKEPGGV
uniref:Ricin B lectin domain-containing protein n=1 Tax=Ditylenchus dipsaci TaxID=166011 RepID=A0A915DYF9_9BILA